MFMCYLFIDIYMLTVCLSYIKWDTVSNQARLKPEHWPLEDKYSWSNNDATNAILSLESVV